MVAFRKYTKISLMHCKDVFFSYVFGFSKVLLSSRNIMKLVLVVYFIYHVILKIYIILSYNQCKFVKEVQYSSWC